MWDVRKMDDIDDNLSPQESFERTGNDPSAWACRAEALLSSAGVLGAQYHNVPSDDPDAFWEFFKLHTVGMMLKGMAVECLLKAVWTACVSSLVAEGRFRAIPGTKDHDLLSLVTALEKHVDLGLSKKELELLPILSFAITSGRYPVRKNLNARPAKPEWVEKMRWCKWEIPADDIHLLSIVSKLLQHISKDVRSASPSHGAERGNTEG
jgi:hypothetical protein